MDGLVNIIIENIVSIITAIIACWALFRTTKIQHVEKNQRAHWFFDEYLFVIGKCIEDYEGNKVDYYAHYLRYLLYADNRIKRCMNNIDTAIQMRNKKLIISEVNIMINLYNELYCISDYNLKTKNRL